MRLTDERLCELRRFADITKHPTMTDLLDTIEALQQENEQLKADCDRMLGEVQELTMEYNHIKERLQISPYGDDKIDELDEALENCKFQYEQLKQENEQLRAQIGEVEDKGKISDGYHTFNELYYHRMILFSVICNHHKDIAWKSWKHADGTMFDDYFIVGITTPKGDYTYHYQKQYWNIFDVKELEFAPEWDGHQPKDIDRLLSIIPDTDYHNPAETGGG